MTKQNFIAKVKAWWQRHLSLNYYTTYKQTQDVVLSMDEKCPLCGANVRPYEPGHNPQCPYSVEKNFPKRKPRHARN